jgi:hypothetical protein
VVAIVCLVIAGKKGPQVQTDWDLDELISVWTLVEGNWDLIANKSGVTRLGFAVMLKFYEIEGRFPAYPEEVPPAAAHGRHPGPVRHLRIPPGALTCTGTPATVTARATPAGTGAPSC